MQKLRDLNLNSLRVVESAARTGSFVLAAEEQLITPSAVSQRIKNLEAQLQFKIFNRRNNSVILTLEGDAFVAQVREALDKILSAGLEARSFDRDNMLKVSTLPTFSVRWLLPQLSSFKDHSPDIKLSLANSYAPVNFAKEDFDVAIRYGNGEFGSLESVLLFTENLTPVCSPDLLDAAVPDWRYEIAPANLAHLTLLHSDTCRMNWQYWLEMEGAQFVLGKADEAYFGSCMYSYEAATCGVGVAIANLAYMADDINAGKLVAPFASTLRSGCGWYLVYPSHSKDLAKVDAFRHWIMQRAILTQNGTNTLIDQMRERESCLLERTVVAS